MYSINPQNPRPSLPANISLRCLDYKIRGKTNHKYGKHKHRFPAQPPDEYRKESGGNYAILIPSLRLRLPQPARAGGKEGNGSGRLPLETYLFRSIHRRREGHDRPIRKQGETRHFLHKGKMQLRPFLFLSRSVKMEKERRNLMMETEGEQDEKNTAGN